MTDQQKKEDIEKKFRLTVSILTPGVMRVTNGDDKSIDIYATRYFIPDIGERGKFSVHRNRSSQQERDDLIIKYFEF